MTRDAVELLPVPAGSAASAGDGAVSPYAAVARASFWTASRCVELRRLWASVEPYLSASMIGAQMGTTKNAVIGCARRLGLPSRERPRTPGESVVDAYGEAVRAGVAERMTQSQIAAKLCIKREAVAYIVKKLGIAGSLDAKREALIESNKRRAAALRAKRQADPAAPLRKRNPMLTAAQQAQVDKCKARSWAGHVAQMRTLPPVSDDEADALVRQWLARNKPTVCPPAAEIEAPINAGMRFK